MFGREVLYPLSSLPRLLNLVMGLLLISHPVNQSINITQPIKHLQSSNEVENIILGVL